MLKIRVPATSANLGPGFDCLGISLKLFNYYTFKKTNTEEVKFDLTDTVTEKKIILTNEENLTYKAIVNSFELDFGIEVTGKIAIPISRGLGSSAAAIIAGIVGTNLLSGQPLTDKDILNNAIDIEGHPDNIVPAFRGGFNISIMTDDGLVNKKLNINSSIKIILVIPEFQISTSKLRNVLPAKVDFIDAVYNHSRTALMTACFSEGDWENLSTAMKDRLHQDCRAKYIPGFHENINTAYLHGARGVALSGSGPTLVVFAEENCNKIGRAMVDVFKNHDINSNYIITEPDNEGTKIY